MNFTIKDFYKNILNTNTSFDSEKYQNCFFNFKSAIDNNFLVDSNYVYTKNTLVPILINYYDKKTETGEIYSFINSLNTNNFNLNGETKVNRIHSETIKYSKNINTEKIEISAVSFSPKKLIYDKENNKIHFDDENLENLKNSFLLQTDILDILKNIDINITNIETSEESGLFIDELDYNNNKNLFSSDSGLRNISNYIKVDDENKSIDFIPNFDLNDTNSHSVIKYVDKKYELILKDKYMKESTNSQCFFDIPGYITIFSESTGAGFEVFKAGSDETIKFLGSVDGNTTGIIKVYCDKLVEVEATT